MRLFKEPRVTKGFKEDTFNIYLPDNPWQLAHEQTITREQAVSLREQLKNILKEKKNGRV